MTAMTRELKTSDRKARVDVAGWPIADKMPKAFSVDEFDDDDDDDDGGNDDDDDGNDETLE